MSCLSAQSTTVSTMAELRSAIANAGISTININPGTYLLTSSGSGQLQIERNLTIQNTGGGRVVIDANNASRVFYINAATVTLTGLTITRGNGNSGSEGAGMYVNSSTLTLTQSTVNANATSGSKAGGGIWANSSTLNVVNSTISGNSASGSQGGGIYANGGSVLVSNSTVASNTAASSSGGGIYRNGATLTIRNALVADNTGGQINGSGTITGQGTSLVEGGCTGCPGGTITSDPQLGALQDNGGDSHTHALPASSPATHAGAAAQAEATDQRGITRPQGPAPDIGAFEMVCTSTSTVSTMAQLRTAIGDACISTININPGTYLLTSSGSGQLSISRTLSIANTGGGEVVIDANAASRVFNITAGTVTMTGLTIRGGRTFLAGPSVYVTGATLRLIESTVKDGYGDGSSGAGIYGTSSSTIELTRSTVNANWADGGQGGGVYSAGTLTITNSTIHGNTSNGSSGGGLYTTATVTITNSTIASNSAPGSNGGGILRASGTMTLKNTIVADNNNGQISGTIVSNGYNLVEGGCTGCAGTDKTADPKLGALADNGGPTRTQALLSGSPAIDAALNSDAPATDQRGTSRPQGSTSDIGAFEAVVGSPASSVTPDGGQALAKLPSNGTNYNFTFVVTNTGTGSDNFGLKVFRRNGAAITIVSVDGVAGDTTTVNFAASQSRNIVVVYSVGSVAAGTQDSLFLRATAAANQAKDSGYADLSVVRPSLTMSKSAAPSGVSPPGTELGYTITFANAGSEAAVNVVHVDSLPAEVDFKVASVVNTLPPGVGVTVSYSNNGGATWTYTPVSGGCGAPSGFDACVTQVRWALQSDLGQTPPDNAGELRFVVRIR